MLKKLFTPNKIKLSKLSSPALKKFAESMKIGYMEWHDGVGYDLESLKQISGDELKQVESVLISMIERDWRDVEALAEIDSEEALLALKSTINSKNLEVRVRAVEKLTQKGALNKTEVEMFLVKTIPAVPFNCQEFILQLASQYPTPAVKRTLLWCTLYGNDDIRHYAAALIYHLYGITTSSFDVNYRTFFFRFRDKNLLNRKLAYDELCDKIQVDPQWAIENRAYRLTAVSRGKEKKEEK